MPDINSPAGIRNRKMTGENQDLNEWMRQENKASRDTDNSASQDKFGNPDWAHNPMDRDYKDNDNLPGYGR